MEMQVALIAAGSALLGVLIGALASHLEAAWRDRRTDARALRAERIVAITELLEANDALVSRIKVTGRRVTPNYPVTEDLLDRAASAGARVDLMGPAAVREAAVPYMTLCATIGLIVRHELHEQHIDLDEFDTMNEVDEPMVELVRRREAVVEAARRHVVDT